MPKAFTSTLRSARGDDVVLARAVLDLRMQESLRAAAVREHLGHALGQERALVGIVAPRLHAAAVVVVAVVHLEAGGPALQHEPVVSVVREGRRVAQGVARGHEISALVVPVMNVV
ncbi:hypothetical protein BE20_55935 [Sorangium cellulosum]|nr:hypothetical protein BE20_55935 [Sorangium cellulosum]